MELRWLTDRLPPARPIERRTEADYYGASDLIASQLGYASAPRSWASWKHGIAYSQEWAYPELILIEGTRLTRHLLTTQSQADMLRRKGYLRVHAIGAPFLYVDESGVPRRPGSLLVMPAHSVYNSSHAFDEVTYVQHIAAVRRHFTDIVACIGAPCVRKGQWTRSFEAAGIPWVEGANSQDGNALRRMAVLFDSFEYVTTNTAGSHIVYAAHRGCKVSIWGPYAEYRLEDFRGVPWYERNWDRAKEVIDSFSEASIRRRHPDLFRDPWEAQPLREWAARMIGAAYRRTPAEVARLLGWSALGNAEGMAHRLLARVRVHLGASLRMRKPSTT